MKATVQAPLFIGHLRNSRPMPTNPNKDTHKKSFVDARFRFWAFADYFSTKPSDPAALIVSRHAKNKLPRGEDVIDQKSSSTFILLLDNLFR